MPRTRSSVSRQSKVDEILKAAQKACVRGGYAGLSVSAVARELGVAQNAVYWYFPSKDHLYVAVAARMLESLAKMKPRRFASHLDRILWMTDALEPVWRVCEPSYGLAADSEVVADFLGRLDALITNMLSNAFRDAVPPADRDLAVQGFRAVVEGTYVRQLPAPSRRRIISHAVDRLAPVA